MRAHPIVAERKLEALRHALGDTVLAALVEPTVVEILANPDGRIVLDVLGSGRRDTGERLSAEARDLFRRPLTPYDLKGCEAIVFDPPRAGAIDQTAQIAGTKAAVVVGVSCNPQTFARDARVLIDAGFRLERVTPVDQFLWSAHV
ncbi:MAG: hypothetical protein IE911_19015, partial [Brevundimonas sp.]|nr:hypothetical protein [Brevundimonas sp.]